MNASPAPQSCWVEGAHRRWDVFPPRRRRSPRLQPKDSRAAATESRRWLIRRAPGCGLSQANSAATAATSLPASRRRVCAGRPPPLNGIPRGPAHHPLATRAAKARRNAVDFGVKAACQVDIEADPEEPVAARYPYDWRSPSFWSPCADASRPRLFLAPMEGLGDRCFRVALSAAFPGSFDEASTEFLRLTLPSGVDPWSLRARRCFRGMLSAFAYDPQDLRPAPSNGSPRPPLALQLMLSGDQGQLGSAFVRWMLESGDVPPRLHPSRVDINMGCPSRCTTSRGAKLPGGGTTRRGAGSSLLRAPADVAAVTAAMREGIGGHNCCLSVKMRLGFDDEELFERNLEAAAQHADFVQIHGRTKADGYARPARWEKIAQAVEMLRGSGCRVVGNGDIISATQAKSLAQDTGVDGIMIGRGAVANPFLFYDIRAIYGDPCEWRPLARDAAFVFFETYYQMLEATHAGRRGTARFERTVSSKLKQMIAQGFLLNPEVSPPGLVADMSAALRSCNSDCKSLYMTIMDAIDRHVK